MANGGNNGKGRGRGGGRGGGRGRGGGGGDNKSRQASNNNNQQQPKNQRQARGGTDDNPSILKQTYLQMFRIHGTVQSQQELVNRTKELGVSACANKDIAACALRALGAGNILRPAVVILLVPVDTGLPPQQPVGPGGATAVAGPARFTIMGTSNGLQPGLATNRMPPACVIGVVSRGSRKVWVLALDATTTNERSALSWVPTTDETQIHIGELLKMDLTFNGFLAVVDSQNGRSTSFVAAGIPLVTDLRAALDGRVTQLVACAKMLGNGLVAPIPANSLDGNRPTTDGLIAFMSWLGAAARAIPIESTVGVSQITFA